MVAVGAAAAGRPRRRARRQRTDHLPPQWGAPKSGVFVRAPAAAAAMAAAPIDRDSHVSGRDGVGGSTAAAGRRPPVVALLRWRQRFYRPHRVAAAGKGAARRRRRRWQRMSPPRPSPLPFPHPVAFAWVLSHGFPHTTRAVFPKREAPPPPFSHRYCEDGGDRPAASPVATCHDKQWAARGGGGTANRRRASRLDIALPTWVAHAERWRRQRGGGKTAAVWVPRERGTPPRAAARRDGRRRRDATPCEGLLLTAAWGGPASGGWEPLPAPPCGRPRQRRRIESAAGAYGTRQTHTPVPYPLFQPPRRRGATAVATSPPPRSCRRRSPHARRRTPRRAGGGSDGAPPHRGTRMQRSLPARTRPHGRCPTPWRVSRPAARVARSSAPLGAPTHAADGDHHWVPASLGWPRGGPPRRAVPPQCRWRRP